MKISYTDTAKEELAHFEKRNQEKLEQIIQKEKYVFGDEVIEITASDIRQAEKRFSIEERDYSRYPMSSMLLKAYFVAGALMTVFGLFYDKIMFLINENPKQLIFIMAGIVLMFASFVGNYYIRFRMEQRRRFEEKLRKEE